MESSTNVRPIDSFTLIYKILAFAGFYKHLVKPKSYWKYIGQQMWRSVGCLMVLILNLIHLIYIYQKRDDIDTMIEVMMIEIAYSHILARCLVWNLYSNKLDRIHDSLASEPLFLPTTKKDEEFLAEDKNRITVITKRSLTFVAITSFIWMISFFIKRLQNPETQIHIYVPFETNTWLGFSVAVLFYTLLSSPWNVYGNTSFDCAIAAYYSQARTQLQIIRYHLERLTQEVDDSLAAEDVTEGSGFQYRDMVDPNIKERFVYIVKKYEKVVWYMEEVGEVLDKLIGSGFLVTCVTVCICVHIITSVGTSFSQVGFLISYTIALLVQVFVPCYFGDLVANESSLLNTSIYMSEWYTFSPRFRREILIAMERWSRPLAPRVNSFVVIPLSLSTFLMIVKSTYSLYTMLSAVKSQ